MRYVFAARTNRAFVKRNCAFVNFTNISNAIKAIDGVKNKPDYANLRIAHGKDRCANPPRSGPQGGSSARRNASGNSINTNGNGAANGDGLEGEGLGEDAVMVIGDEGLPIDAGAAEAINVVGA